jgi:hypothetical protein
MAYTTIDDPSAYFTTLLYTGNATDDRNLTNDANAGDFKPDWLWLKERSSTSSHQLHDSTRGSSFAVMSDSTGVEDEDANRVQAFQTNGFQVGTASTVNQDTITMVAWQWKANGGTTASNTDGTITSTVQANTDAGFSIVTYTGTGSNATIGHGLGAVPDMVIVKNRTASDNWGVQLANVLGNTNALRLNLTDSYGGSDGALWWNDTSPTSTTVSIGTRNEVNQNTKNYVMYCFKNIQGYSKIGSYVGNGNADGTFVYTGFKPAFVLLKSSTAGESWELMDNKRLGYNGGTGELRANLTNAETTSNQFDLLSNGFKPRTTAGQWNTNNETYIYAAFAESPFVSSEGVPTTAR